jgi:hypothetical protein
MVITPTATERVDNGGKRFCGKSFYGDRIGVLFLYIRGGGSVVGVIGPEWEGFRGCSGRGVGCVGGGVTRAWTTEKGAARAESGFTVITPDPTPDRACRAAHLAACIVERYIDSFSSKNHQKSEQPSNTAKAR